MLYTQLSVAMHTGNMVPSLSHHSLRGDTVTLEEPWSFP